MTCEQALFWIQVRPQDLEASQRELLEAHLKGCAGCRVRRQEVVDVSKSLLEIRNVLKDAPLLLARPTLPRRKPLWPWAAAAALLVWFGISRIAPEKTRIGGQPPRTTQAPVPPPVLRGSCQAEAEDLEGVVGRSVLVSLRRGSALAVEGPVLTLKRGACRVDAPGEAVSLKAGGSLLNLTDAAVSLEILEKTTSFSWLGSAHAAEEPEVRIAVWRGRVEAAGRTLDAGQGAMLRGQRLIPDAQALETAWKGIGGWLALESVSLRNSIQEFLPYPPAEGYVLEALVRKRVPTAELGLRLPAADGVYEFPLGALLPPSEAAWTRLRVECHRGWCRAAAGQAELVSCPLSDLGNTGRRAEGQGVGLRAWGGDVEVKEVRWRQP